MTTALQFRRLLLGAATALTLLATGCKKDDPVTPTPVAPKTIVDVAVANPDFSILVAAVTKTQLVATLSGTGPFTVFAPTNAAFGKLPASLERFNTAAKITALTDQKDIDLLKSVILYHALSGNKKAADFPNGASAQTTAKPVGAGADNVVYVSKTGAGVFVNGNTKVVIPDVAASNGTIHAIDQVLLPPSGTIADVAIATPSLSILVEALKRPAAAGLLTAALDPKSNLTVFAPTNAAFQALLTKLGLTSLAQVPDATLVSILQAHIVTDARAFSPDLTDKQSIKTLNGNVTIGVSGAGVTVAAPKNTTPANVALANVLANNGVVHVIDAVLLP